MKRFILIIFLAFLLHSLSGEEKLPVTENLKITFKLNNINIAGIALLTSGTVTALSGIAFIIVDDRLNIALYGRDSLYDSTYTRIRKQDYTFLAMGIAFMFTGGILITASIPMMLYKKKNVSLKLSAGNKLIIAFCYNF